MTNKKGFTLIELLVVIAIIGILSAIGLVSLNGAREKARDAQRKSDLSAFRTALALYYDDNASTYPTSFSVANSSGTTTYTAGGCGGTVGTNCLVPTYMGQFPRPPQNGNNYAYVGSNTTTAQDYRLYTALEIQTQGAYYWVGPTGAGTSGSTASCSAGDCTPD